jgi:2-iminobutanoate/2-iminopropanoate deaminase
MKMEVKTPNAPTPIAPYSQAVKAGNTIYVSAQLACNMSTGKLVTDNIEAETKQVLENIKAILAEANADYNNVVKVSIFLKDMQNYETVNGVYNTYVSEPYPARETIEVGALPKNVNVEISAIAVLES